MINKKNKFSKFLSIESIDRGPNWFKKIISRVKSKRLNPINLENRDYCNICNSKSFEKVTTIYKFQYCKCLNCNSLFIRNRGGLSNENIYDEKNNEKQLPLMKTLFDDNRENRKKYICKPKIDYILSKLNLLPHLWIDYGCGIGDLVESINEKNINVYGCEINEIAVDLCKKNNLPVYNNRKNKSKLIQDISNADIISLISVIEHLEEPREVLETISKYSKKNSYLAIEIPRSQSLSTILNLIKPDMVVRHMLPPEHVSLLSDEGLDNLLKHFGYAHESSWFYGSDINYLNTLSLELGNSRFIENKDTSINYFQSILDKAGLSDERLAIFKKL